MEKKPFAIKSIPDITAYTNTALDERKVHRPPSEEIRFYLAVASGDVEYVQQNCLEGRFYRPEGGAGILSKNPVTNLKYHYVITISIICRFCSEAGIDHEFAYNLADYYIGLLDSVKTEEEIIQLHDAIVMAITYHMQTFSHMLSSSKVVDEALDYISKHILERITADNVADALQLSRSYFSRLFKTETNLSFSDYVRKEKVKVAENLLRYSDYSIIEISNYLGYSTQSYFSQVFKKETGYSPKDFRDKFFKTVWHTKFENLANFTTPKK
ncbi:helix-turn-helix domain-containing protein [Pseudobutyrivibrio xylanivorans]|uniref:Helix-turn-helix transcriptional regulator n=1 Tax=Pseudobutyrivibrio xylanivorans TaxID=185007 RepID=A0A5P6VP04_PSEXY|nr:AraC family transcriptional regulator [Pseudobutyrivibrio xylanivorans]QFJ54142.1 helix-turn-helix transcriptional regulator [Pseudobutyrivibrio xylanivorans]